MSQDTEDRRVFTRAARAADRSDFVGSQPLELYFPCSSAAPRPLLLLLHGGFWRACYDRAHLRPLASALAGRGWPVALAEYSRAEGGACADASVADVFAAAAAARGAAAGAHDGRLLVVGHSAGGHLALLLAARAGAGVAGTLALAPVASLARAEALRLDGDAVREWLGCAAAARPDLDPCAAAAPPPAARVRVLHGTADARVPLAVSAAYKHADKYTALPGIGHFELVDPEHAAAFARVLEEIDALAAAPP
jgi:acetyl esterase/lipase